MKRFPTIFTAALAFAALFMASCSSHTLFNNAKSHYSIVVAADAPESEQYAAVELQSWIDSVAGVSLPIVGLDGGRRGRRLIVGYNSLTAELVPDAAQPSAGDDAFTWCNAGGDILLWGGSKRGTLYSVYSFLEEELDCRWYSSKVSVAPERKSYSFSTLYNHEEPGILIRDNCVLDVRTNPVFSARTRNNFIKVPSLTAGETIPGTAEGYWGVHALGYHCPSSKYFAQHPEYFSLRDGVRQGGYAQLCLSNPEVLQIVIESVRKVMREQPDYLIYSVEQNDNYLFCTCDECQALVDKYGGQSGIMLWFVNQVADAVKDEFPDKYIGTFAYQYTRHAPKDIVPRDNVVIRLCSIECCMLHDYDKCERNLEFKKDLDDWGAIAPHLYIWDYVTDFSMYCLPVANWKTMQPHLQDYRDSHAIGILEEGDYQTVSCEFRELRSWLLAKLMWNPDADVDALIKDFTDGYYGAAGPYIRKYLDLEERVLRREGIHAQCYIYASDTMYTDAFVREGRALFAAAKKAVADDKELYDRVETAEMPLCYLQMENNPLGGVSSGADALVQRVVEREGITRMSEGAAKSGPELVAYYQKMAQEIDSAAVMPAQRAPTSGYGVAYTYYEGPFTTTEEMLSSGEVKGQGTMPGIVIKEAEEIDHFGYKFDTWLKVAKSGMHQLRITSDDGTVVFLDGKEIINLDGSHGQQTQWAFLNLEEGLHRLDLRFFDDNGWQGLDILYSTPDGYVGTFPADRLFVPVK